MTKARALETMIQSAASVEQRPTIDDRYRKAKERSAASPVRQTNRPTRPQGEQEESLICADSFPFNSDILTDEQSAAWADALANMPTAEELAASMGIPTEEELIALISIPDRQD